MIKKILSLMVVLSLIIASAGCTGIEEKGNNKNDKDAESSLPGKTVYAAKKSNDIMDGNKKFAFELFKELNKKDSTENMLISPYSISAALSMVYNGAKGGTKEAMAETLKYIDILDEDFNKGHKYLKQRLENLDKKVDVDISNSIWINDGEEINQDFIDTNVEVFDAYIKNLDFSKDEAAEVINKWISSSTNGLIDQMINPPIPRDVIMYLINTIYFKGDWSKSFDVDKTEKRQFKNNNGQSTEIDMMYLKDDTEYVSKDDYRAIRLPYGDKNASMYCILPEGNEDINEFIKNLTDNKWDEIKSTLKEEENLLVRLPKFKLEYGVRNINEELKAMGMEIAFEDRADFSGIRDDMSISNVLHKAVIEVDEKGTEAAAATVVEMKCTGISDVKPPQFIANRPFLFIIADNTDGTILFIGKVADLK